MARFGPPVASLPAIDREENDNRKVEVCVERIRPGLYCIHSQWEKPQCKTRSTEDLRPNDDSIAGTKKSDEMPFCTPVDTTVVQSELQKSKIFGFVDMGTTGLFKKPEEKAVTTSFSIPTSKQNTQNFGQTGATLFKFGSPSSQNSAFAVFPVNSTLGNFSNGSIPFDKIFGTHHQRVVYVVDFMIDRQSYVLKASFTKSTSTMKIVGSLALTQVEPKSINATEKSVSGGGKDELNLSNGMPEEDLSNHQPPSAIWANLNGAMTKILPLKKSLNLNNQWVSENFDGSFAYSERLFSVDEWKPWKPLTSLLWIEFETFSGGEKNVLKQLADMHIHQKHCDVQFTFEGDDHIGGHVNILMARSSVFAAMFEHDMKEAATREISIVDVQPDIFKQLLHYMYSGRLLTPLTEASAQPLFVAADKYDINDLKEECVHFLLTCVRVDNAINLLVWAHLHSADELEQIVVSFMTLHGKEVCHLKEWEDLTKNYPDLCMLATRRIIDSMCL